MVVSCPDHTLYAREGLVHQVQILGSVPQNEERPIRSLKDYVITFLSILYRFDRGSGNDIHSDKTCRLSQEFGLRAPDLPSRRGRGCGLGTRLV